ncbi:MAG: hypothetical protein ACJAU3_000185 [Zhongshania sp.]|jgi:hypothetical protein
MVFLVSEFSGNRSQHLPTLLVTARLPLIGGSEGVADTFVEFGIVEGRVFGNNFAATRICRYQHGYLIVMLV